MGRILGRVEYGAGEPDRFFIHDDTSGWSIPPLFVSPDEAWNIYDSGKGKASFAAAPKRSTRVRVIRKVLAYARTFARNGDIHGEPSFGLATDDRLLYPLSKGFEESRYVLLKADGVLHVAEEDDGGFSGDSVSPLCAVRCEWNTDDPRIGFRDLFNHPLDLCPRCVTALTESCS